MSEELTAEETLQAKWNEKFSDPYIFEKALFVEAMEEYVKAKTDKKDRELTKRVKELEEGLKKLKKDCLKDRPLRAWQVSKRIEELLKD